MIQITNITPAIILIIIYFAYNYLKNLINKKDAKYISSGKWTCNGVQIVPAHSNIEKSLDALIAAPKFIKWLNSILSAGELIVPTITVTDVDWFSAKPDPAKLGFVKCVLTGAIETKTGTKLMSNIVFIRGDSVAVLIIVKVLMSNGSDVKYVLQCEQMRAPVGKRIKEICAGMTDGEGNIMSVALKEVKEETGICIKHVDQLTRLGKIMPSPGACDEVVHLYSHQFALGQRDFEAMEHKIYGNADEHEEIRLSFVEINKYKKIITETGDVKGECAFRRLMG